MAPFPPLPSHFLYRRVEPAKRGISAQINAGGIAPRLAGLPVMGQARRLSHQVCAGPRIGVLMHRILASGSGHDLPRRTDSWRASDVGPTIACAGIRDFSHVTE